MAGMQRRSPTAPACAIPLANAAAGSSDYHNNLVDDI
jgi:hypothetical protein